MTTTPDKNRPRGDLWAIVSAVSTACGLVAAKPILREINPISLNGHMFLIGAVILFIDSLISGKVKQTVALRPAQLLFLFIISILFCGAVLLFYTALSLSEPATVSFLSRLELAATLIFASIFLKERISLSELTGLIPIVAGIMVMRYNASVELSRAVFLVVGSSLLLGAGEVAIKSRIHWVNHRTFIFYRNLFMAAIFVIVGYATGTFTRVSDLKLLGLLCIAALFLPYMGRMGYLKAMQNINISRASIIVQSQPFFAAAAALLVLGTFPSPKELIGGLLIVTGVVLIRILELRAGKSRYRLEQPPAG